MEDQGKRLLLAVAIAFALLWGWSILFPTQAPEKKPEENPATAAGDGNAKGDESPGSAAATAADGTDPDDGPSVAEPAAVRGAEKLATFKFDDFEVDFSNYGGSVKSWRLLGKQFEDRRVTPPIPLDMVPTGTRNNDEYDLQVSLGKGELGAMETGEWTEVERAGTSISYRWKTDDVELTKTFEIDPEHYMVVMTLDIAKRKAGEVTHELAVNVYGYQDPKGVQEGGMTQLPREWKAACLVEGDVETASSKSLAKKPAVRTGHILWGGFHHSYFVVAAAPQLDRETSVECTATQVGETLGLMRTEIKYPPVLLQASDARYRRKVATYLGPKFIGTLEQASELTGFEPKFEDAVDLGWLSFLSAPLLWMLTIFQGFLVSWGLSIILLTLVVKLLVLPWTHKSIKSMKGMSKLKPQMEKIKEKYGDDKQKQQVETMALFKNNGVNPLAGCLPMILQMPIWFALYRMLMNAAEIYQAPFLWMDDLTAADPYYIMPILVTGMMFLQTRLTPTTATGVQAKVIMYGMPIMFGFFSFVFPAGLTVYIFTNTCLTLVHYYFVHKEDREKVKEAKKQGKSVAEALSDEVDDGDHDDGDDGDDDDDDDDDGDDDDDDDGKSSKSAKKTSSKKRATPTDSAPARRKTGKGSRGGKGKSKKNKKKKKSNAV